MLLKKIFLVVSLLVFGLNTGQKAAIRVVLPIDTNQQSITEWVDSMMKSMSLDEKIAQLIVVRGHSNKDAKYEADVANLVSKYQVGGICFFQGTPAKQALLTNYYQSLSKVPMMVSMDAEWGLGMRLTDSVISFPRQMTLGAIEDEKLIEEMGREIARQLRRIGVHVNFAPVADINNNPANPVINSRSFGDNRENVAVKALAYAKGLQSGNVIACAKHFPGHGDTQVDSHEELPRLGFSRRRLDTLELFPFATLANQGVQSIMTGHLQVPALDPRPNMPASLSSLIIQDLLVDKMGFKGLVFTDGLEMKGVTKYFKPGELEAQALQAGNDILLLPRNVPAAIDGIKNYLASGKLVQSEIDRKVRKVLESKYKLGLSNYRAVELFNLTEDLNTPGAIALNRTLSEKAITLIKDSKSQIPLKDLDKFRCVSVALGRPKITIFQEHLRDYTELKTLNYEGKISDQERYNCLVQCKSADLLILSLHGLNNKADEFYGLSDDEVKLYQALVKQNEKTVLVNFGTPYLMGSLLNPGTIIQCYEEGRNFQELAAQLIFGSSQCFGKLPVSVNRNLRFGMGMSTAKPTRLGWDLPERVGLSSIKLKQIDMLAMEAISTRATPGCQILVAKDGQIIYDKSFGNFTYQNNQPVNQQSIYDLASLTKIAATTISVMKLQEMGKMDIDEPLGKYLEETQCTNKEEIPLRQIMIHRAGLRSWIPFYEKTLVRENSRLKPSPDFYTYRRDKKHQIKVIDSLYLLSNYREAIWDEIVNSDLPNLGEYKYSDLGFYMLAEIIKRRTGSSIDVFAEKQFYKPLLMNKTCYRPLLYFKKNNIVPSEVDKYFRMRTVQGYVHDMGAAMLGGISGHAGLFSTSRDLAILMQMLLNKGTYGGRTFLKPETVRLFTSRCNGCGRRGIGFDMGMTDKNTVSNMSRLAGDKTYGHTGFTGTCTWVDPDKNLVYIFLSNRTFPTMDNRKLNKGDYRERIHTAIYESML